MPLQATSGAASYDAFGGGVAAVPQYIEDVFSTYLYTGNGISQVIENGINLGTSNSGGSGYFDGTGDYLSIASNSALQFGTGDFTFECWIYPNGVAGNEFIADFGASSASGWGLYDEGSGGNMQFRIADVDRIAVSPLTAGAWSHVAVVRSGTTVTLYVNGTSVGSYGSAGTNLTYSGTNYIGSQSGSSNYMNGYISNVRAVKGTAVYTTNFTPSTSPLTAISGTSLLTLQSPTFFVDASSNNFTITRNGDVVGKSFGPFTSAIAGKGGLVWIKSRSAVDDHNLYDTVRGAQYSLSSNLTEEQTFKSNSLTAFNTTGFSLGSNTSDNTNSRTYASWTFRKQPKFFDVVTYTGNGTNGRTVAHSLGSTPGCIIVKRTDAANGWAVYHRAMNASPQDYMMRLNATDGAFTTSPSRWNNTLPTSTEFTLSGNDEVNGSGATYVAYLFAHNAGGFGLTGTDNVISCGSLNTGAGGTSGRVNLGWEPQFVIIKRTNLAEGWMQFDNMRGLGVLYNANKFNPNTSGAEQGLGADECFIDSTGFTVGNVGNSQDFIYIAIRRGPMKVPTSGTSVFAPVAQTGGGTVTTNFPVDLAIPTYRNISFNRLVMDRLRGGTTNTYKYLLAEDTGAETSGTGYGLGFDYNTSIYDQGVVNSSSYNAVYWNFRRAPSFFDEVCYTGTDPTPQNINHNLGVAPELMIVKVRSVSGDDWVVYCSKVTDANIVNLRLNKTQAVDYNGDMWDATTPTATTFRVGQSVLSNYGGQKLVAYLFATCAGVSKVGSYTGTGTTKQVDCGFTGGARFVLIKRTDSTGDWYVWDSARGIVSGNDPYLLLNSTAAEVTSTDYIDTYSAGFEISSTAPAAINASGGTFIFLAIA